MHQITEELRRNFNGSGMGWKHVLVSGENVQISVCKRSHLYNFWDLMKTSTKTRSYKSYCPASITLCNDLNSDKPIILPISHFTTFIFLCLPLDSSNHLPRMITAPFPSQIYDQNASSKREDFFTSCSFCISRAQTISWHRAGTQ